MLSYSPAFEDSSNTAGIQIDKKKFTQVLRNLLSNALKLTEQTVIKKVLLEVDIEESVHSIQKLIVIHVKDFRPITGEVSIVTVSIL